jgi:hypothetical protein
MSAWFDDDILWESLEGFLFSQFRSFARTRAPGPCRPVHGHRAVSGYGDDLLAASG